ncbi:hypothetical protein D9M71_204060 [compost metagenome]
MQHAAQAVFVELAHDAAGEHRDFIRMHVVEDGLPGQAGGAQRVGGAGDGQLQAAGVEARVVQLARLEAGGQLAGGFHRQLAVAVDLEFAAVVQGDLDLVAFQRLHRPVGRQRFRQLLGLGDEGQRLAVAAHRHALLPVHGGDVHVLLFDAAHQGRLENLLAEAFLDGRQVDGFALGGLVLAALDPDQLHHHCQAGEGLLAGCRVHRLDDRAAETMVEGTATRCVIPTKTNDDR